MKIQHKAYNTGPDQSKKRISKTEDRNFENIKSKENKVKRMKRVKESLYDL